NAGDESFRATFQKRVDRIPVAYLPLLLDPGIVSRLDLFEAFLKKRAESTMRLTAYELRREFARSLPRTRIFRALALQTGDADHILQNGMLAPGLRVERSEIEHAFVESWMLDPARTEIKAEPVRDLHRRVAATNLEDTLWMSGSLVAELAASAAKLGLHRRGQQIYVFAIDVSPLGYVPQTGPFVFNRSRRSVQVGADLKIPVKDEAVEVFLPYAIPSSALRLHQVLDPDEVPDFEIK
ncbi:MAG: hypothetical protein AAB425_09850, partial [Bdellovibrionota bacterium]